MAPGASASVHISSQTTAASAGDYPNTATASASNAPPVDATATIKVVADVPVVTQGPPVTTTPPPTTTTVAPPQLPRTGAPTAWLAGLGLALIAAGAALAQSRKRRRNEVV
jgi:LPXTG-motif cell wall-anchored protein